MYWFSYSQIEKNPRDAKNYTDLAEIYCEAETKPEEALQLAKKAVELKADSVSYYVLGRAYLLNNNTEEALINFTTSLNLNKNNIWCLFWLGKLYKYKFKDNTEAKRYFKRCIDINPRIKFIIEEMYFSK